MKSSISLLLTVLCLSIQTAIAQEFILFDDEITVEEEHNGFYYFQPPENGGNDWLKPYDYYQGKFFARYEVLGYPSQAPLILNVCIWSDVTDKWASFKETCSPGVDVEVNNAYCIETSPFSWWKKSGVPVDFSRVKDFKRLGMVLFCERWKNISPWVPDSLSCWDRKEDHLPLKLRFTVICVAHGFQFGGWEKYGFSTDTGKNSPSRLKATEINPTGVELQWKDNSDTEVGFIVERSPFPNEGFVEIASVDPNVTTCSDKGLNKGTTYYYRVKRNGFGVDDFTSRLKVKPLPLNICRTRIVAGADMPSAPINR